MDFFLPVKNDKKFSFDSGKSRQVTKRGILLEYRATLSDEIKEFNAVDKIPSWEEFRSTLHQENFVMDINLLIQRNPHFNCSPQFCGYQR